MIAVLTSVDALQSPELAGALATAAISGCPVAAVSNHTKPPWFDGVVANAPIAFLSTQVRQDGHMVALVAEHFKIRPQDVIVLALKSDDVRMGKNGGALLVGAAWSQDRQAAQLGIVATSPSEFVAIIDYVLRWNGGWWYRGTCARYSIDVLADLSGYGQSEPQREFGERLTAAVKRGGARLKALSVVAARSMLNDGYSQKPRLLWGCYPSSSSSNTDGEVLSEVVHGLRTSVSRVHYAKRGHPLFIRHRPSVKRSTTPSTDRSDPSDQLATVHLNPYYRETLPGRSVVVVDDCVTYGVSIGVAAALLLKAGAASITGCALGKFGDQLHVYDIAVTADPYAPVPASGFRVMNRSRLQGQASRGAQNGLIELLS